MNMRNRIAAQLAARGGAGQMMTQMPVMASLGAPPAPLQRPGQPLPIPQAITSPELIVPDTMQRYYERIPDAPGSPFARAIAAYQQGGR